MNRFFTKSKKPYFWAFLGPNWPKKIFFSKIGLRHILDIIILRQCAKFHEKISSTAWDIQEILFFWRKLAVSAIFRQFRLQKSNFLTIETCLMVGIAINNVFVWKRQRNMKNKSKQNLQKRRFPAYFRHFRPKKKFSQKSDSVMFWALLIRIFEQKITKI